MATDEPADRPRYQVTLRLQPGRPGTELSRLRLILKCLRRSFGVECLAISAVERASRVPPDGEKAGPHWEQSRG